MNAEKVDYVPEEAGSYKACITIIQNDNLAKSYDYIDGKLIKKRLPFQSRYAGFVGEVTIQDLCNGLTQNSNISLICGYPNPNIVGSDHGEQIELVSKDEFLDKYPNLSPPYYIKEMNPDGSLRLICTRTKDIFTSSNLVLLDCDFGNSYPEHIKKLSSEGIVGILEEIDLAFKGIACLEAYSSSSGLVAPDGTVLIDLYKRHIYTFVKDASDIDRFVKVLTIRLVNAGYYYPESSKDGKRLTRTLFDTQAISAERVCYETAPLLNGGLTQNRPKPRIFGKYILDTRRVSDLSKDELKKFREIRGKTTGNSTSIASMGTPQRQNDLEWDIQVTLSNGEIITPREFKDSGQSKAQCHSPFRVDNNPSAVISLDSGGNPYIYDAATNETHFIVRAEKVLVGEYCGKNTKDADEELADQRFEFYTEEEALEFMNSKYAVVLAGSKCLIMEPDAYNHDMDGNYIRFYSSNELGKFLSPKFVKVGNGKYKIFEYWSTHKHRRQYINIVFNPTSKALPSDVFNIFRGFHVKPKKGNWRIFIFHMLNIICKGDKRLFKYVFAWMANMVQGRPKPGVALVLIGGRGTGKSIFASIFGALFGRHYLHIIQRGQLIGNFNSHLREAYLVFADEAFWAGDHQGESALKALITEDTMMIEQKGIDAIQIKNYVNVIFATNSNWSVPAGMDERRFCVLEVSDERKQDHAYFAKLKNQMQSNGGLEAMLYDLQNYDLSNVNLRHVPATEALAQQKYHSDPVLRFLIDKVDNGTLSEEYDASNGNITTFPWGDGRVLVDDLYGAFVRYAKRGGERYPMPKETFGKNIRKCIDNVDTSKTKIRPGTNTPLKVQTPCYKFPDIDTCKASIDDKLGAPWNWTKVDIEEELAEILFSF
jgi:hypothetical protein